MLLAVEGAGSLVGATLTPWITRRWGTVRSLVTGNVAFAGGAVVLSVTTRTYRQTASPPDLLSRVMATVRFVSWGGIPVGGLIAGALAGLAGARATLFVFAAATVLAPLALILSPVRGLRDLADLRVDDPPEREMAAAAG
ncbi:hypothetical protein ACNAW0_15295 [Micromonospora sp. SL1-18]|uniref:hypothetical protein n=1 Tax=Micromonospora sp. SL1-18 TaxID=3399128 RepID=UPI003A4DC8E4